MKIIFITLVFCSSLLAAPAKPLTTQKDLSQNESNTTKDLVSRYKKNYKDNRQVDQLRQITLQHGRNAVPALITVMKGQDFPDKNRWVATFLMGQIMGSSSADFIAQFLKHPHWVMRLASLKTILKLGVKKYQQQYIALLQDKSLLVRVQALENIRQLELAGLAPNVWAMLYDEKNYSISKEGIKKRTSIIEKVIEIIGELRFQEAVTPMLTMLQNKKYQDLFPILDASLKKITGKSSPNGTEEVKKIFWKNYEIASKTF